MTPLFSLDNVCFAYEGHIALRYITLDVARGETVVLQGSNGCGKSTLLKLLNGLVYAEEGTYKFDGDKNLIGAYLSLSKHTKMFFNGGLDKELDDIEDEVNAAFFEYIKKFS